VRLGAFFANELADLKFAHLGDEPGAQEDTEEERRDAGEGSPERDVTEDTEAAHSRIKAIVEEVIEH
jgi:hypothetical protein